MWPIRLCHNSMFVSVLGLLAYMADFTSFESRISFSPSFSYESAIFLDKANSVVEMDFHALLHNLADQDQILSDGGYVKDILDAILLTFFPEWDIAMCRMGCVVSSHVSM